MLTVPTAVVDGDVELLVSRSLLVFYMATSALRPLLTEGRVGEDWESRIGAWYLPFTACAYCTMSFAEDVRAPLPAFSLPACGHACVSNAGISLRSSGLHVAPHTAASHRML